MNTEFKSMVQLMRSKDPTNRDLGFELAKGVFPEFWAWFEGKVTEILNYCYKSGLSYLYLSGNLMPKDLKINGVSFDKHDFWEDMRRFIRDMKYFERTDLDLCTCGKHYQCGEAKNNASANNSGYPDYCNWLPF